MLPVLDAGNAEVVDFHGFMSSFSAPPLCLFINGLLTRPQRFPPPPPSHSRRRLVADPGEERVLFLAEPSPPPLLHVQPPQPRLDPADPVLLQVRARVLPQDAEVLPRARLILPPRGHAKELPHAPVQLVVVQMRLVRRPPGDPCFGGGGSRNPHARRLGGEV